MILHAQAHTYTYVYLHTYTCQISSLSLSRPTRRSDIQPLMHEMEEASPNGAGDGKRPGRES